MRAVTALRSNNLLGCLDSNLTAVTPMSHLAKELRTYAEQCWREADLTTDERYREVAMAAHTHALMVESVERDFVDNDRSGAELVIMGSQPEQANR
jgi:hypothetical protein